MSVLEFEFANVSKLVTKNYSGKTSFATVEIHLECADVNMSEEDNAFYHEIANYASFPQDPEIGFLVLHDINKLGVFFSLKPPNDNKRSVVIHIIPWHKVSHINISMGPDTYNEIIPD